MVNLVFPPFPAILPIALDKWSPFKGFTAHTREETKRTPIKDCIPRQCWRVQDRLQIFLCRRSISPSVTSKVSRKSSSNLTKARASCKRKVKWSNISVFRVILVNVWVLKSIQILICDAVLSGFFHTTYFDLESEYESSDKICCFCEWADVSCLLAGLDEARDEELSEQICIYCRKMAHPRHSTHFDFNVPGLEVESNLELEVFYNWRENLEPVFFQWRVSVCWNCHFSHLVRSLKHTQDNQINDRRQNSNFKRRIPS